MNTDLGSIIRQGFTPFADRHGLIQRGEVSDGWDYSIEYASDVVVIRLGSYRYEVYATLFRNDDAERGINLFNLVAYLTDPSPNAGVSDYFRDEPDFGERFRRQVNHIAATLESYWTPILQFFTAADYLTRVADVQAFMIRKYPDVFRTR